MYLIVSGETPRAVEALLYISLNYSSARARAYTLISNLTIACLFDF